MPTITSKDHKGIEGVLTVVLLQGGEGCLCVPIITSKDHKGIEGVLTVVLLQGGEGLQDNVVY